MALPPLPGYSFNAKVGKEKFHKSQHWGFCNNVSMLVSESKPGIGGELLPGQKMPPKYSAFPEGTGCDAPPWVVFDKHVLSFDAYTEGEVRDKRLENYRIRRYKIYFYPEDDTIQVNEPEMKNSGFFPGVFIRRHRIPLPPPDHDQFYTVYHFNIGRDIVFYGQTFKIYDCDAFTKNFMKKIGVKLNPSRQCPEDPYMNIWRKKQDFIQPFRHYEYSNSRQQFLDYNKKILRFFCLWDDSDSMFGDRRKLILSYFLIDDTIEIKELLPHNTGRDAMPFLLKRSKLPKDHLCVQRLSTTSRFDFFFQYIPIAMYQPGDVTEQMVLNVYSGYAVSRVHGYKMDVHKVGKLQQEFYKDSDLFVGATINVWGRKVLLCDCDRFTKTYYKNKYGIENVTTSVSCDAPPPPKIERKFPPYTGFGSEEDSLCSCIALKPKPCPYLRNYGNSVEEDSKNNVLRFLAKLITRQDDNKHRLFIISYFLSDGTMSVFEPKEKNSVSVLQKYLKRMRVKRPGQEVFKSELSEYIKAEELYIGAKLNLHGYLFLLISADESTLKLMEDNSDKFPFSKLETALQKLKEKMSKSKKYKHIFMAADSGFTKKMDYNTFRDKVMAIVAGELTEQEFITIARHYQVPEDPYSDVDLLIAMAHKQFKKNNFEDFEILIQNCVYEDCDKKKVLPRKDIRRLCKSSSLPLTDDLLESLLSRFEDSEEQINYESFFCALNWRINPMPELVAISPPLKERCDDVLAGMLSPVSVEYIYYFKFLQDMYGSEEE